MCASTDGCRGLLLDTSKNNSRRWCSMDDCGTEAKIRRQTARRRTTTPAP
ncbi:CGNR zinc finger domain-containing protein [Actinoplanes sp. CA-015351]